MSKEPLLIAGVGKRVGLHLAHSIWGQSKNS
jgi:hypothetical protein